MKGEERSMKDQERRLSGQPPGAVHASRITHHASRAFTLIELLVVIAIMGLLAAIAMPAVNKLKPNAMAAATQKLLADVGRARQLAIAHHTTVYMVFVPPSFWNESGYAAAQNDLLAQGVMDKQMVGYNFVSLRSIGDQPGRNTVRYLDTWRTLPEGAFIPRQMFVFNGPSMDFYTNSTTGPLRAFSVAPFSCWTNGIPFPAETASPSGGPWIALPYIAFNYLGQLVDANKNNQPIIPTAYIPLSQGTVGIARDASKAPRSPLNGATDPTPLEKPVGNTTNTFNVIHIDGLTGRARVERQELL